MADLARAEIAAVIPARNEAGAIGAVVRGCWPHVGHVVVVDDGSTDDTAAVAATAGAHVVSLARGHGKGFALRTGVAATPGRALVLLDGDGQDDPADIPRLIEALRGGADLVIGSRFLRPGFQHGVARVDRWGNRALTACLNRLHGACVSDSQAGFRAIRRPLWDRLPLAADGFAVETEVLVRALQAGATVAEVPVARRRRVHGQRVLRRLRDGAAILGCIVRLALASPRRAAGPARGL